MYGELKMIQSLILAVSEIHEHDYLAIEQNILPHKPTKALI